MHHPCRASTSLEARHENPSLTCFQAKQTARSWCVSRTIVIFLSILWRKQQTVVRFVLRHKMENPKPQFEAKPRETVDLGFEAKPRNPRSSSPCELYRPHTMLPDLLIVRPLSTLPVLDHPRSSASCLLLLPRSSSLPDMSHLSPAHHKISKHDSPHKIDRVEPSKLPRFEFKPRQVNY
jgi:hypothetical protein